MSGLNAVCRTPTTEPSETFKVNPDLKKARSELRRRYSAVQVDRSTRSAGHVQKKQQSKMSNKAYLERFYRFIAEYYDQKKDQPDLENDCKKRLSFESPRKVNKDIADLQNLLQNTTLVANPKKMAKLENTVLAKLQKSGISAPPNTPVSVRLEEAEEMIEDLSWILN